MLIAGNQLEDTVYPLRGSELNDVGDKTKDTH